MLTVTVQDLEDTLVLRCFGRIVSGEETPILCAMTGHTGRNVILDLKDVSSIDATGIGLLVSLQAAGFYLRLANPISAVRETLTAAQLDSVIEICDFELTDHRSGEATTDFRAEVTTPAPNWRVPYLVTC